MQNNGIVELDRNLTIADAYGRKTSFTCNEETLNKIIKANQIRWKDKVFQNSYYKGIHKVIIDNNLDFGKCIIKRGDESKTWEIMIF